MMKDYRSGMNSRMGRAGQSSPTAEIVELLTSITPVSRETLDRLSLLHDLLRQWQAKTNLVSPSTLPDYWTRHVADSAQLFAIARRPDGSLPANWVDIGSGGGFPGLVLAILLAEEEANNGPFSITLIESIQKKCAFLRRVVTACDLPSEKISANVACSRIESVPEQFEQAEIITARALASLEQLLEWTAPFLEPGRTPPAQALFHKGRDFRREIEESRGRWTYDLVQHVSRIDPESVVLEITNVVETGGRNEG